MDTGLVLFMDRIERQGQRFFCDQRELLRQGVDPDIIRRASGLSEDENADSESFLPPDSLDAFLWKILPYYT